MKLEIDIDHNAPVVVTATREIDASLERIWAMHSDVPSWLSWQRDIRLSEIDGNFAPGSEITWSAHGYADTFPAYIGLVDHQRRTVWSGSNGGVYGIHQFVFVQRQGGVDVQTSESWAVNPGQHAVDTLRTFLENWLDHMKVAAEGA